MLGLSLGRKILTTHFEAWLLIASGVIILGIAAWMLWRTGQSLGWFRRHRDGHHHHHYDEVSTVTMRRRPQCVYVGPSDRESRSGLAL